VAGLTRKLPTRLARQHPPSNTSRAVRIDEVMTRRVLTAMPGEALSAVIDRMMERKLHHVPVVENGVPLDVLARHDLLGFLARRS
jgi:CBS domain-containing protein